MNKYRTTILGFGDLGSYLIKNISDSINSLDEIYCKTFDSISDLKTKNIQYLSGTKALFLVLHLAEKKYPQFIPKIESFQENSGIPVFTIAIYPFLWEGYTRISWADGFLQELIRISYGVFRVNSHQWFHFKEQLGFHQVVELVNQVAGQVLLLLIELQNNLTEIQVLDAIHIAENVIAIKQQSNFWNVNQIILELR